MSILDSLKKKSDSVSTFYASTSVHVYEINYSWKINNYSFLCEVNGEALISEVFYPIDNEELKWRLYLYPNGAREDDTEFLSIFLELVSTPIEIDKVKACCQFSIIKWIDGKSEKSHSIFYEKDFFFINKPQGKKKYIKISELQKNTDTLLLNDTLTLHCCITAGGATENNENQIILAEKYKHLEDSLMSLSEDFEKSFNNQQKTDVKLICEDGEIQAHKYVLITRSPVFAAMFEHNTIEHLQNKVKIDDIKLEVLKEMLRFMYSGKFMNTEHLTEDLLAVAEKYGINSLKEQCESDLSKKLSIENAARFLVIADLYKAQELKNVSLQYVLFNILKIKKSTEFLLLVDSHPHLLAEIFSKL